MDGVCVVIWEGDGVYESGDVDVEGFWYCFVMVKGGFEFEYFLGDY